MTTEGRTRRVQVLELLDERGPMTIPELAEAMGVLPNYLYRVLPHLTAEGLVKRNVTRWMRVE